MPKIEENDVLAEFLINFHRSEDFTKLYFDRAETHYKNYRLYRTKSDFPYANSVFCPDTFNFVEDANAKECQALLSHSPIYSVVPRSGGIMEVAHQLEVVLQWAVESPEFEFFIEFLDFKKNAKIFGTSFLSVIPDFHFTEQGLVYKGPRFDYNDFWDIFPDPQARRLGNNCRYIIKRSKHYIEELLDLEAKGIYKNVKRMRDTAVDMMDDTRKQLLMEIGVEQYLSDDKDLHEILEMYTYGHVITLGDRQIILRDTRKDGYRPYPYDLPLVEDRYVTVPGEFYGVGIPEILRDLDRKSVV